MRSLGFYFIAFAVNAPTGCLAVLQLAVNLEDDPAVKPLRDRLREVFGEQEAMSVIERLNGSVEAKPPYS